MKNEHLQALLDACERTAREIEAITEERKRKAIALIHPLSDETIQSLAERMPKGLNGFCKEWGYLQFARAIEAAHGIGIQD